MKLSLFYDKDGMIDSVENLTELTKILGTSEQLLQVCRIQG